MLKRCAGRVKWFNKKGFGFITAVGGSPRDGEDVFVHHSALRVEGDIYKYLVQGEYVTFTWTETTSSDHEWHATDVRGINNWQLMCESQSAGRASSSEENTSGNLLQEQVVRRKGAVGGAGRKRKVAS
jgi:cold shock CspA family protein